MWKAAGTNRAMPVMEVRPSGCAMQAGSPDHRKLPGNTHTIAWKLTGIVSPGGYRACCFPGGGPRAAPCPPGAGDPDATALAGGVAEGVCLACLLGVWPTSQLDRFAGARV